MRKKTVKVEEVCKDAEKQNERGTKSNRRELKTHNKIQEIR
jgi:hypothetical protein